MADGRAPHPELRPPPVGLVPAGSRIRWLEPDEDPGVVSAAGGLTGARAVVTGTGRRVHGRPGRGRWATCHCARLRMTQVDGADCPDQARGCRQRLPGRRSTPTAAPPRRPAWSRALCDRHRGVGADGLIRGRAPWPRRGRPVDGAAQRRRQRGRDERQRHPLPGPGGRRRRAGRPPPRFTVATAAGVRAVDLPARRPCRRGDGPAWTWARCGSGERAGRAVPAAAGSAPVDVGNPTWCSSAPTTRPTVGGGRDRTAPRGRPHPGGLNVEFIAGGPGPRRARACGCGSGGSGETLACGTGSCAAAAAARTLGLGRRRCVVHNPGGALEVALGRPEDDPVVLAGPVRRVAERAWSTSTRLAEPASAARHPHRPVVPGADRAGRGGVPLDRAPETVEADLDELALLVDTAGADVVARVVQRRDRPDPATYVGQGQGGGAGGALAGGRRRHRGLRRRADAGPAAQPGEDPRAAPPSTARR